MTTPFRYSLKYEDGEPIDGKVYRSLGSFYRASVGAAETHARHISDKNNNETVWIAPVGGDMNWWWVRAR
jgi:hypothetical protein